MRTLAAGLGALRRTPLAAIPFAIEGVIAAALVMLGAFPASGVTAPAAAVFPLDIYFDLKQSLANSTGWLWFIGAILLSVMIRSTALTATLWFASEGRVSPRDLGRRIALFVAGAVPALLPAALFLFVGVAVRYAPFVWVGAILGVVPALILVRKAVRLEASGIPLAGKAPTASGFLGYAYLLGGLAAAMTLSARIGVWPVGAILLVSTPIHVLFLLGWREQAHKRAVAAGPPWALILTAAAVVVIFGSAVLDRFVRDGGPPVAPVAGSLVLLGGINSTTSTGALSDLDPRRVGFSPGRTTVLSYRRDRRYGEAATHGNLGTVAGVVAAQLHAATRPVDLIGHSQAALILDRILKRGLDAPNKAVLLSAPPPYPPSLTVPPSGRTGPGVVAGDIARPLSRVFELFGANGFNLDAPAAPFNLKPVIVSNAPIPRVAVWALGDSVWLEGDWRRPGETNVVAVTDHVGMTNDPRALGITADFFAGRPIASDESSWRGAAVDVLSYVFEPWRPR